MVSHMAWSRGFRRSNWETSSSRVRSAGVGTCAVMVPPPVAEAGSVYASALRGRAREAGAEVLVQLDPVAERLGPLPHLAVEVIAHRPHQRVVGGQVQALVAGVV